MVYDYKELYKKLGVNNKRINFLISADIYTIGYAYANGYVKNVPFDTFMTKSFILGLLDAKTGKPFRIDVEGDKEEFLKFVVNKNKEKFKNFEGLDNNGRFIYFIVTALAIMFGWIVTGTKLQMMR